MARTALNLKGPITDKDVKDFLRNPGFLKWQIVVACLQIVTFFLYIAFNIMPYWVRYNENTGHASIWFGCETKVYVLDDIGQSNVSDYTLCQQGHYCQENCGALGIDSQPRYIHCTRILMVFSLAFYIITVTCGYTSATTRNNTYTFVQEHWANVVGIVGSMPGISALLFFNTNYNEDKRYQNVDLDWGFYLTCFTVSMMVLWFPIKTLPYRLLKRRQRLRDIQLSQLYDYSFIQREDRRFGSAKINHGLTSGESGLDLASLESGRAMPKPTIATDGEPKVEVDTMPPKRRKTSGTLAVLNNSVFFAGRRKSSGGNFNIDPNIFLSDSSAYFLGNSNRGGVTRAMEARRSSVVSNTSSKHNYMSIDSRLLWTNKRPGGRKLPKPPVELSPRFVLESRRAQRNLRSPSPASQVSSDPDNSDEVSIIRSIAL